MYKNIHDPKDPWAWRNTWTGESRTDYAELWVVVPLIAGLVLLCLSLLVPLFIYIHCRNACPCPSAMKFFERFLLVLHQIGLNKVEKREIRRIAEERKNATYSFTNPAFDPNSAQKLPNKSQKRLNLNRSMRAQNFKQRQLNKAKPIKRSNSCPSNKHQSVVPKIRI